MSGSIEPSPGGPAITPRWSPGPERARLAGAEVHLWRVALTAIPAGAAACLSAAERERGALIISPSRRQRWMAGRAALRLLLGRYVDGAPAALRIADDAHGRLGLEHPEGPRFNLSHSGPLALFAFARSAALGVDVEQTRRQSLLARPTLAGRLLGPRRAAELADLPERDRAREFLRAWVRHEAGLKCGAKVAGLIELELGPDLLGALAYEIPPQPLRCWELDGASGPL